MLGRLQELSSQISLAIAALPSSDDEEASPGITRRLNQLVQGVLREAEGVNVGSEEQRVAFSKLLESISDRIYLYLPDSADRINLFIQSQRPFKRRGEGLFSDEPSQKRQEIAPRERSLLGLLDNFEGLSKEEEKDLLELFTEWKNLFSLSYTDLQQFIEFLQPSSGPQDWMDAKAYVESYQSEEDSFEDYREAMKLFSLASSQGKDLVKLNGIIPDDSSLAAVNSSLNKMLQLKGKTAWDQVIRYYRLTTQKIEVNGQYFETMLACFIDMPSNKAREKLSTDALAFQSCVRDLSGEDLTLEGLCAFLDLRSEGNWGYLGLREILAQDPITEERGYTEASLLQELDFLSNLLEEEEGVSVEEIYQNVQVLQERLGRVLRATEISLYMQMLCLSPTLVTECLSAVKEELSLEILEKITLFGLECLVKGESIESLKRCIEEIQKGTPDQVAPLIILSKNYVKSGTKLEEIIPAIERLLQIGLANNVPVAKEAVFAIQRNYSLSAMMEIIQILMDLDPEEIDGLLVAAHILSPTGLYNNIQRDLKPIIEGLVTVPKEYRVEGMQVLNALWLRGNVVDAQLALKAIGEAARQGESLVACRRTLEFMVDLVGGYSQDSRKVCQVLEYAKDQPLHRLMCLSKALKRVFSRHTADDTIRFLRLFHSLSEEEIESILQGVGGLGVFLPIDKKFEVYRCLVEIYGPLRSAVLEEAKKLDLLKIGPDELIRIYQEMSKVPRECVPGMLTYALQVVQLEESGVSNLIGEFASVPSDCRERMVAIIRGLIFREIRQKDKHSLFCIAAKVATSSHWQAILAKAQIHMPETENKHHILGILIVFYIAFEAGQEDLIPAHRIEENLNTTSWGILRAVSVGLGVTEEIEGFSSLVAIIEILLFLKAQGENLQGIPFDEVKQAFLRGVLQKARGLLIQGKTVGMLQWLFRDCAGPAELFGCANHPDFLVEFQSIWSRTCRNAIISRDSIYEIDRELKEKKAAYIDLTKIDTETESGIYRVNVLKLIKKKHQVKPLTFQELGEKYPEVAPDVFTLLFASFQERINALGEEAKEQAIDAIAGYQTENMYCDREAVLQAHVQNCCSEGQQIREWMDKSGDAEEAVPKRTARLYALANNVLEGEETVEEGDPLSEREKRLLGLSCAVTNCSSGQNEGIDASYRALVGGSIAPSQFAAGGGFLEMTSKILVEELGKLEALLSEKDPLISKLVSPGGLNQLTHQAFYLKNLLVDDLHLDHSIEFDEYGGCVDRKLREASHEKLLSETMSCLLDKIAEKLCEKVNRKLEGMMEDNKQAISFFNTLSTYLSVNNVDSFFEEKNGEYALTYSGAMQLLQNEGYLHLESLEVLDA